MNFLIKLARHFLQSTDYFVSFISWVSVVGMALGVFSLIVVTAAFNGFQNELRNIISQMYGDVVVFSRTKPFTNHELLETQLRKVVPEIQSVRKVLNFEVMLASIHSVAGAILEGISENKEAFVIQAGRMAQTSQEITIASELAKKLHVKIEDKLKIILPFQKGHTPEVLDVQVVGIAHIGMYEFDSKFFFMNLSAAQELFDKKDQITRFSLKLSGKANIWDAHQKLVDILPSPFRVKDYTQFNQNLFYAIQMQKAVIAIILAVIVIVAAFNVISTLMIMIHDKQKQLAILKTMGLSSWKAFNLFMLLGTSISVVGISMGVGLGCLTTVILREAKIIHLPMDVYNLGHLPLILQSTDVLWIAFFAFLIGILATCFPAWKVAQQSPLEGLRS